MGRPVAFPASAKLPRRQETCQLTPSASETHSPHRNRSGLTAMSLAALGVVFGDIGTSPLYTLKTVLDTTGAHPSAQAALGSLSLIGWALIIVTSVEYVALAMR